MSGLIAAIALAMTLFGGGGLAYASQDALPGQALYPVKGLVEAARLGAIGDDAARAMLHLRFADRKMAEIQAVLANGQDVDVTAALESYSQHMSAVAARVQEETGQGGASQLEQAAQARLQYHVQVLERVRDSLEARKGTGAENSRAVAALGRALENAERLQERHQERGNPGDGEENPEDGTPRPADDRPDRDQNPGRGQGQARGQNRERDGDQDQDRDQDRQREQTPTATPQPAADAAPTATPQQNHDQEQNREQERHQDQASQPVPTGTPAAPPAQPEQPTATPVPQQNQNQEQNREQIGPGAATDTPQPAQNQEQHSAGQP